jgi:hypothetical protein
MAFAFRHPLTLLVVLESYEQRFGNVLVTDGGGDER